MEQPVDLSIVIPSFNSEQWLPSTIAALQSAHSASSLNAEIVVVDDGSTDATQEVLADLSKSSTTPIRIITTANQGVYLARLEGARAAASNNLLFVDSRVVADVQSLSYLQEVLKLNPTKIARIGHVTTDESVPLVGRFWEVPTHVFWGRYLRSPKQTLIDEENFDNVPKGTGFLVLDRSEFLSAVEQLGIAPGRFVSDDTKLLRAVVETEPIILDPKFCATYRPRTSVRRFLSHGFLRGTLFVDSYFGTSALRSFVLIAIALSIPIACVSIGLALAIQNWLFVAAVILAFGVIIGAFLSVAAVNRAPGRALVSFATFVIPFAFVFWAGIVRGLWLRMINHE